MRFIAGNMCSNLPHVVFQHAPTLGQVETFDDLCGNSISEKFVGEKKLKKILERSQMIGLSIGTKTINLGHLVKELCAKK